MEACGGFIELLKLLAAMDYSREIVLDETRFFAGPETCEDENGIANAGFADGDAFFGAGYAKPMGASFFESFGDLRAAVAVAVAFDDAENLARCLALLFGGIHELADYAEILGQCAEGNFGPDGTTLQICGIALSS